MRILLPMALFAASFIGAAISSRFPDHTEWSRRLQVAMLILVPPCAILPLRWTWGLVRRKKTAVFLVMLAATGMIAFTLLLSFTGFLIQGAAEGSLKASRDSLLRFKALHVLGFPILLGLASSLMAAITLRLARRFEAPSTIPGPAPSAPGGETATEAKGSAPPSA